MNYYDQIKNKLIDNEVYERVKDYSKERHRVRTYYEVGELLSSAGKHYGENIIGEYSKKLVNDVGKRYSSTLLKRMRKFYNVIHDEKMLHAVTQTYSLEKSAPLAHLSWSHIQELLPIKDINKRNYYIDRCIKNNLSRNALRKVINEKEYERLSDETKIKLIEHKELEILDEIKNPIIIHSKNIKINNIKEKALKKLIIENLDNFLKQLGNGYSYIGNEYKIKLGDTYNYIDILLYNYIYKCFVVIELKVTELKKEHIGQVMCYMNYIDFNLRNMGDNKTIGLIVVKENDKYIIRYSSDKRIKAIEYSLI